MSRVRAVRLSVYLGNADLHRHRALSSEIVHRAHRAGLSGASTMQGILGYGRSAAIHTTPRWGFTDRTPVTVHIIDTAEEIDEFLPQLRDIAGDCLIVRDEVELLG